MALVRKRKPSQVSVPAELAEIVAEFESGITREFQSPQRYFATEAAANTERNSVRRILQQVLNVKVASQTFKDADAPDAKKPWVYSLRLR